MTDTNELAEDYEEGWTRFRAAVDKLDAAQVEAATPAGWTAKEMIGHMAFWEEAAEAVIVAMFRGDELPPGWAFGSGYEPSPDAEWPPADVHNAREAAWARSRTVDEVLKRLDAAHARSSAVFRSFTPEEVADVRFRDYVAGKVAHFDEHLAELDPVLR